MDKLMSGPPETDPDAPPGADARALSVLVVDDDELVLATISAMLARQGFQVFTAGSAARAQAIVAEVPGIGVVVSDIDMPGRGGLDLAEDLLRDRSDAAALEIVIVTGHPTTENAVRAVRGQIFDFLAKPLRSAQVGDAVRRARDSAADRREQAARYQALTERMLAAEAEGERLRNADIASRNQLEKALTSSDRLRAEILAVVSHELRTPLIPIIGLADILLRSADPKPETVRSYLHTIHQSGQSLLRLVDGALELLDSERPLSTAALEIDLEPMLARILLAEEERGGVRTRLISCPNARVRGEPVRLSRAFSALIDNAVKASTGAGGVVVVSVSPGMTGELEISIIDRGSGISDKVIAGLGTPFLQDDMTATRGWSGAGMGLAIAHRIIQRHDGQLMVRRRNPGPGTEVIVTLPEVPAVARQGVSGGV